MLYLVSRIKIKDLMTKEVTTVPPDYTIEEAAQLLLDHRISGLPVTDYQGRVVGIITQSDIFRALISITGLGKKGMQVALRIPDKPGPIKEVREMIRARNARTASILSATENAPEGFINVYFRIYDLDREIAPALLEDIRKVGTLPLRGGPQKQPENRIRGRVEKVTTVPAVPRLVPTLRRGNAYRDAPASSPRYIQPHSKSICC